jgi:hypothetical protein
LWLACLVIILSGMLARARAQFPLDEDVLDEKRKRSHLINENLFGLPAGSAEELFLQRLKTIHTKEIGEGLGKQLGRAKLDYLRASQDRVAEFLKEFKFESLPKDLQKKFAGREADLEKLIQSMDVQQFLKYAEEAQGIQSSPEGGSVQPGATTPAAQPAPAGEPARTPSEGESRPPEGAAAEANPSDQPANSVLGRWLLKAANRFKNLDPALRDSPALRRIVRELSGKIDGTDERWKKLDEGANAVAEKWARVGRTFPLDRLLSEGGLSWPRGLTGESLPTWRWPETQPRLPATGLPGSGLPDMSGSDAWRAFWVLVLLTAISLILWKTVRHAPAHGTGGGDAWKLGPWPITPTAVQTRAELIQAFEYLSVLRLGPAARNWHHWTIASGLASGSASASRWSNPSAERRRAAEQLALLYERARYAPPAESLPEAALATARRDLCLLGGVPLS